MRYAAAFILIALFAHLVAVDINEGFEGASFPPSGWDAFTNANQWGGYSSTTAFPSHTGSRYARCGITSGYLILRTPRLLPTAGHTTLSFWIRDRQNALDNANEFLQVMVTTDMGDNLNYTELVTYSSAAITANYSCKTIDLSAYANQIIYVGFEWYGENGNYLLLDDVAGVTLAPPGAPTNPFPADGAVHQSLINNPDLSWANPAYLAGNDVYLSTTLSDVQNKAAGARILSGINTNYIFSSYNADTSLSIHTTYYWRVVEAIGIATTDGPVWSFTTSDVAPGSVTNPSPASPSYYQPQEGTLSWTFGSSTDRYDLWLGTPANMVRVVDNAAAGSTGSYNYSGLTVDTQYNWQVVSRNDLNRNDTPGPVWTFFTPLTPRELPYSTGFEGVPDWYEQVEGFPSIWSQSNTSHAGCSAPEVTCSFHYYLDGISRWVSPPLNTSGVSSLYMTMYFMLDDARPGATLLIQSSPDRVNWTDEPWSLTTSGQIYIGPTRTTVAISNIGSETTYLAIVVRGYPSAFDHFYADDVTVSTELPWAEPPTNPFPADNAAGVALNPLLQWEHHGHVEYTMVYFSTDYTALSLQMTETMVSYTPVTNCYPASGLAYDTTYYWRIMEYCGDVSYYPGEGPIWSFTTGSPPPEAPEGLVVAVSEQQTHLTWNTTTNALRYLVYSASSPDAGWPAEWTQEATVLAPETSWSTALPEGETQRFYRITASSD
jgi:hypothetical protein